VERQQPILARDWHDLQMERQGEREYSITIPLTEVGYFEAKAFFLPQRGEPIWPEGGNIRIKVEPAEYAAASSVYTAFVRQFSAHRYARAPLPDGQLLKTIEAAGYAVIPPSGTFRQLQSELDHIIGKLGFRILQLLPIHPVPTTYARMGRFGSPYAALDFMDVDPALAEFDRRTTPLDQFHELVDAVHQRQGRLFIDIPINHTGWASWLQIHHPEWFARAEDRSFQSPGAWGVTWEDLAKLDYRHRELWTYMAEVFLYWCRQGVDGFRCDAGYMIPVPVWQYICAKVRQEFPDTIFLLEGLGGTIETTEALLTDADLDWAYSEIFQTHGQQQMDAYLPACIRLSAVKGPLVHFAETHDNNRLAVVSPAYARFRTALAALCSQSGAFGITAGVEWFATAKLNVHDVASLNWGAPENQVHLVGRLNAILQTHPAFRDGVDSRLIHTGNYNIMALLRTPSGGAPRLLVLANFNEARPSVVVWPLSEYRPSGTPVDLISGRSIVVEHHETTASYLLGPLEIVCLTDNPDDPAEVENVVTQKKLHLDYCVQRAALAKALEITTSFHPFSPTSHASAAELVRELLHDPRRFCAAASELEDPPVTTWVWPRDLKRVVMVPPRHCLLVLGPAPFLVELCDGVRRQAHEWSLPQSDGTHFALIKPLEETSEAVRRRLQITVYTAAGPQRGKSVVLYLSSRSAAVDLGLTESQVQARDSYAICANAIGAMVQVRGNWGELRSQYDALLAANLHPEYPVDRHIMLPRCRAWLVHRGYSRELSGSCLRRFRLCPPRTIEWRFDVPTGMGKFTTLDISLTLMPDSNAIALTFSRQTAGDDPDRLGDTSEVRIIVRPDLEDRVAHSVTKAYLGPEHAWPAAIHPMATGFVFRPAPERHLTMTASSGTFTWEPQWHYMVPHPFEAARGLNGSTDLFSPGYFTLPLRCGESIVLNAAVSTSNQPTPAIINGLAESQGSDAAVPGSRPAGAVARLPLRSALEEAIKAFIVRRDHCLTVIAGYPWFLDWGRDTLICLRGIIAAGLLAEARRILLQFASFESQGTLPNMIKGNDASNRDTSDTPLWFFVACADLMRAEGSTAILNSECHGRSLREVLESIASNYISGTPNGIVMDPASGLIFSPAHFTWMDTNYPAGTPREGYPIEIQALWYAALTLMEQITHESRWSTLRSKVLASILRFYIKPDLGYVTDCLHAQPGQSAKQAVADDAVRPNQLLALTLGAITDMEIRCNVLRTCEELLAPGAIRSLADRPVTHPLPILHKGVLLNDPLRPYWGTYQGDEDTRRKPAYHNGTAWTWLFPSFVEALFLTFGEAVRTKARALLYSSASLINQGCLAHVPEIVDGDAPHTLRGCGAQAWGATELYRVLRLVE